MYQLDPIIAHQDALWDELKVGSLYRIKNLREGPYPTTALTLAWDAHVVNHEGKFLNISQFDGTVVLITKLDLHRAISLESYGEEAVGTVKVHFLYGEMLASIILDFWADWKAILKPVLL